MTERVVHGLREDIKKLEAKLQLETEEKDFFHKNALDTKRKYKIIKVCL